VNKLFQSIKIALQHFFWNMPCEIEVGTSLREEAETLAGDGAANREHVPAEPEQANNDRKPGKTSEISALAPLDLPSRGPPNAHELPGRKYEQEGDPGKQDKRCRDWA
jgi:hypothetical protein